MHPRRVIRNSVTEHLLAGGTAAEDRVWDSRLIPVNVETILMDQGPIILVYTRKDSIKPEDYPESGMKGGVRRTLELFVEITAVGNATLDDKLDGLAEAVETLLDDFEVPGMPATEIHLESSEIEIEEDLEQPLGGALLQYEVKYWKPYRENSTALDDDNDDLMGDEWSVCSKDVLAVPHVAGTQSGPPEVVGECDCEDAP